MRKKENPKLLISLRWNQSTHSSSEILLVRKLNHVELFFGKIVKIALRNESYKFFFKKMFRLPQNKIVLNFHITYSNEMNKSIL